MAGGGCAGSGIVVEARAPITTNTASGRRSNFSPRTVRKKSRAQRNMAKTANIRGSTGR
jgi:hypothetical protein